MLGGIEEIDKLPSTSDQLSSGSGAVFVLEGATLEVAKVGKGYELLNCDDHAAFLRRKGKDPANYRPDICHQVGCGSGQQVRSVANAAACCRHCSPSWTAHSTRLGSCKRCMCTRPRTCLSRSTHRRVQPAAF